MEEFEFDVGNYYGCVWLRKRDGVYSWAVENYDGTTYHEIPDYLGKALLKYWKEKNK